MTDVRVSRAALETLLEADPDVRISRLVSEALLEADPDVRVSRLALEALVEVEVLTPWPVVRNRALTISAAASSHDVNYPEFVEAGDALIAVLSTDGGTLADTPSGWTSLGTGQHGGNANLRIVAKKAAGTEGGTTFSVAVGSGEELTAIVYAAPTPDFDGNPPDATVATGSSTTSAIPPSHSPAGGYGDYLWMIVGGMDHGSDMTGWSSLAGAYKFKQFHNTGPDNGCAAWGMEKAETAAVFTGGSAVATHSSVFNVVGVIAVPIGPQPDGPQHIGVEREENGGTTSYTLTLPSGLSVGDTLVAAVMLFGSTKTSALTDWTLVDDLVGADGYFALFTREVDGTEGGEATLTTTLAGNVKSVIRAWRGVTGTIEAAMSESGATTTTPDPPSLTPSWGTAETMWVAGMAQGGVISSLYINSRNLGGEFTGFGGDSASEVSLFDGFGLIPTDTIDPTAYKHNQSSFKGIGYTYALEPTSSVSLTPQNFAAAAQSSSSVLTSWDDVSGEDNYRVERRVCVT